MAGTHAGTSTYKYKIVPIIIIGTGEYRTAKLGTVPLPVFDFGHIIFVRCVADQSFIINPIKQQQQQHNHAFVVLHVLACVLALLPIYDCTQVRFTCHIVRSTLQVLNFKFTQLYNFDYY